MSVERYFSVADRHDRQLDRHREVVEQDGQDRDALAHGRLEVHAGEADRRVAPHVDAELVRAAPASRPSPAPGRSRAGSSCPSRCSVSGVVVCQNGESWSRGLPASWVMIVFGDVDRVQQVPDHAVGRHRRLVRGELGHPLRHPRGVDRGDLGLHGGPSRPRGLRDRACRSSASSASSVRPASPTSRSRRARSC